MSPVMTFEKYKLLRHVDNPMHEDRWGWAWQIADRAGVSRRGVGQKLVALEAKGLVESTLPRGARHDGREPRLWRRASRAIHLAGVERAA